MLMTMPKYRLRRRLLLVLIAMSSVAVVGFSGHAGLYGFPIGRQNLEFGETVANRTGNDRLANVRAGAGD